MRRRLPRWFSALTGALVVMNLFVFGLFSMIHPSLPWPDLGPEAAFPIQFFAARHVAFGVVLLHGLKSRDLTILRACYTIFFVIAVLDLGMLAAHGYYIPVLSRLLGELSTAPTVALSLGLFVLPMGLCLAWLRRQA